MDDVLDENTLRLHSVCVESVYRDDEELGARPGHRRSNANLHRPPQNHYHNLHGNLHWHENEDEQVEARVSPFGAVYENALYGLRVLSACVHFSSPMCRDSLFTKGKRMY